MSTPRYLTKSRFKLAVECPTKLFYSGKDDQYGDANDEDSFLALLAEGGYQVGALAKLRYPEGIEVEGRQHEATEARTNELLKRENVVLFEPAIRFDNFFVRIDILVKTGNGFEIIEVKGKSFNSREPQLEGKRGNISSGMLPYLQDVAFQTWVLQQAYPEANISSFLMMPDKAQVAPVDGINQMFKILGDSRVEVRVPDQVDGKRLAETLLAKVDVGQYVRHILNNPLEFPGGPGSFDLAARDWAEAYAADRKIKPVIGGHCGKCQFRSDGSRGLKNGFHECWQEATDLTGEDLAAGTVLDLWNFRGKDKLISAGVLRLTDVTREHLKEPESDLYAAGLAANQRQWLQAGGIPRKYDRGGFFFNKSYAETEIAKWKYPYHFIDFETSAVALPFFVGMRPYQQVAFQFSHHVMEADGRVRHVGQYLGATPGQFPNYDFARVLRQELQGDEGSVFMWSPHENTILKAILEQLEADENPPADAQQLKDFIRQLGKEGQRAMVDLKVLAEKAFFQPLTHGSNSIKKVLPAVLQASEMLRSTYSKPIYGAPDGIPSLNFKEGFAWLDSDVVDPYARLQAYAEELLPKENGKLPEGSASVIAEGGAAAVAYARLQFEDLDQAARDRITAALLRYCELDTFAMVLVVQAWLAWLAQRFDTSRLRHHNDERA
jgi:hypothetical protein